MRTLKTLYRLFRWAAVIYTFLQTFKRSRMLLVAAMLWRLLRRIPWSSPRRTAMVRFVGGGEPAIYRRRGLRRMVR
ncbi:MAG: hypothetical protein K6T63_03680 [Alicyclobacillus herbarius]|uniref:hypothetical protein n=1 Tax=Alicyclobacillus herbarius TaxID=122960 RepID=UPI00047E5642|nr:hypothetical protein [Alicyclobacillus herbarius]MCL6631710.1 hypothetical protein [Alicyclobacillus herbarius]